MSYPIEKDYFVLCLSHLSMVQKYGSSYKSKIKNVVKKLILSI
ncbi:hypothetical protein [Caldicellulosiruptor morganii]|uniref:Uncharacterized protein n=1 Tax=Caldicellulosiruptor morganii TaxID=1387555 RepID=A0ABY7BNV9_9FIRM|nr:hypothetical protein [Caldicellulosiruptor morganii]WAM34508.1 hypothetical protein OTK00_000715 [Caldicellulosiruptor morganii]